MIEVSQIDFKMQFKNLVRRVKYLQSIDRDRDCTNEEIAKRLGYTLPHFNTLVGTGGRVTQDHIRTIEDAYSGILTKNKKEKSGPDEPDQFLLTQIKQHAEAILRLSLGNKQEDFQPVISSEKAENPNYSRRAKTSDKKKTEKKPKGT